MSLDHALTGIGVFGTNAGSPVTVAGRELDDDRSIGLHVGRAILGVSLGYRHSGDLPECEGAQDDSADRRRIKRRSASHPRSAVVGGSIPSGNRG